MALTPEKLAELRRLHEAATPGPWGWRGNDDGLVELRGHGPFGRLDGRVISAHPTEPCIVWLADDTTALTMEACDSCRAKWAEAGKVADPTVVWETYRCPKPKNLATVWLKGEHAIQPANDWAVRERPYRSDVARVDHPDGELIAQTRNALPTLLDLVEAQAAVIALVREGWHPGGSDPKGRPIWTRVQFMDDGHSSIVMRDMTEAERRVIYGEVATEATHRCPPGSDALTLCCGRSPHDLPRTDRLTLDESLVTCLGAG